MFGLVLGIQVHPKVFIEVEGASCVGVDGGKNIVACGYRVALGGIANRLNFCFGDIHIKSPDPRIVVEEM